ncbi:MAG: heat-inducible transcriptional repressor HrcA [Acidobacteriota bacterium]|nr:heat-inducible transcriptional repressor HrcA [Acidobacteriota bacterium]
MANHGHYHTPSLPHRLPDARGQAVLSAIIQEHLVTGEPVGSKTLAAHSASVAGWSPATIRNVMAELEEAGLVEQPHTSAGRVPTDKGYRFYVDHMISDTRLSRVDLAVIDRMLGNEWAEGATPGRVMERVSRLLSSMSKNVGIIISPSLADNCLQHIEFLNLSDGRILVVLVFSQHVVQNRVVRIEEAITQEELDSTARYLNVEFGGKSLLTIRADILRLMQQEKTLYDILLRRAIMLCERSLEGEAGETGDVYVDGASNFLSNSDFTDIERLRELFRTLEEKSRLVRILNECIARESAYGGVRVVIGRESATPAMQSCALFTAPYRIGTGEVAGTLGVVGPMRIEYARMMAVVNHVAQLVERVFYEGPSRS